MAQSTNSITLCGRVGKIGEFREYEGGISRITFSLGTDVYYKKTLKTEWHDLVGWGLVAKMCKDNLDVGMTVTVMGVLRSQVFQGKKGRKRVVNVEIKDIVFMNKALITAARNMGGPPDEDEFTEEPSGDPEDDDETRPL